MAESIRRFLMGRTHPKTKGASSAAEHQRHEARPRVSSSDALVAHRFAAAAEQWVYELKLDGYRAIAFKRDGTVHLRSRNDNDFSVRYPAS